MRRGLINPASASDTIKLALYKALQWRPFPFAYIVVSAFQCLATCPLIKNPDPLATITIEQLEMKFLTAIISLLAIILYYGQAHDQTCTEGECTGIPNDQFTAGATTNSCVNCVGDNSTCNKLCGRDCNTPDCTKCSTCVNAHCPQCDDYCACEVSTKLVL